MDKIYINRLLVVYNYMCQDNISVIEFLDYLLGAADKTNDNIIKVINANYAAVMMYKIMLNNN